MDNSPLSKYKTAMNSNGIVVYFDVEAITS